MYVYSAYTLAVKETAQTITALTIIEASTCKHEEGSEVLDMLFLICCVSRNFAIHSTTHLVLVVAVVGIVLVDVDDAHCHAHQCLEDRVEAEVLSAKLVGRAELYHGGVIANNLGDNSLRQAEQGALDAIQFDPVSQVLPRSLVYQKG